jgi:hypothetical protein
MDTYYGSEIKYFDVQIKAKYIGPNYHTMEIPTWKDWQMNTTNTSRLFEPARDYIYFFRCRAVDSSNNVEPWPVMFDSFSIVIGSPLWICEEIGERINERIENIDIPEHYGDRINEFAPVEDDIPPVSKVEPLFPIHFWFSGICYAQSLVDTISIQVYPYPPSYYLLSWLEELGIISTNSYHASIPISWIGIDNENRSGVKCYDVQYRTPMDDNWYISSMNNICEFAPNNPLDWKNWRINTTETEDIFHTTTHGYYQFRCRATDNSDNKEQYPITADSSVLVLDLRMTDTY